MDAQAPPPPPAVVEPAPPFNAVAAQELYARDQREKDLCASASHPDWLYLSIPPLLVAGAVALDTQVFKTADWGNPGAGSAALRDVGPALVGMTWGLFVGSFMPSMPKCSPHYVTTIPAEGQIATPWPIALSFALLAGITAPIVDFIAIGPVPDFWADGERVSRILLAGTFAFGTALLPYLLPPKTVRAARELERIRATVSARGAFVSYTLAF